jgi:hypothetical protein
MKRILYANGSVLTGDAVAHSVVLYATTLAKAGSADAILVPVVEEDGGTTVEMLIGPSSQLIIEDAGEDPASVFEYESFRAEIERRRDSVEHPPSVRPRWTSDTGASHLDDL